MTISRYTAAIGSACTATLVFAAPAAHAESVAYLVNVTARPGYNFANADTAISYGQDICAKIADGRPYAHTPRSSTTSRTTS